MLINRILFAGLLMLNAPMGKAECYVVSELQTYWQYQFGKIGLSIGSRRHVEYQILIEGRKAQITPGEYECITDSKHSILCGNNLKIVFSDEGENRDQASSIKATGEFTLQVTETSGNVKESWFVFPEQSMVMLTEYKRRPKTYNGRILRKC